MSERVRLRLIKIAARFSRRNVVSIRATVHPPSTCPSSSRHLLQISFQLLSLIDPGALGTSSAPD